MRSNTLFTIFFVAVVAVVVIGEAYVYTIGDGRYSSDVRVTDDGLGVEYSLTSKGSEQYSVLVLDNRTFEKIDTYYIYYDTDYGSELKKVPVPVGAKELTQEYHISQLITILHDRGVDNIVMLNASGLAAAMSSDIPAEAGTKGLIVLSGALPDTIYEGGPTDLIFDWLSAGGSLYWAGNLLGAYYGTSGGVVVPVTGYEELFFGVSGCLNAGDTGSGISDVPGNDHRYSLSLMNGRTEYGVNVSVFGIGSYLAIGYTDGTYCSAAMIKFGKGMICVLAGDFSNEQRHDLAQIVASGISAYTDTAGYANGDVKRGTVTGRVDVNLAPGNNYVVYVYYGGYFTVYGRTAAVVP